MDRFIRVLLGTVKGNERRAQSSAGPRVHQRAVEPVYRDEGALLHKESHAANVFSATSIVELAPRALRLIARLLLPCLVLLTPFAFAATDLPEASSKIAGRVYLFRGVAGLIFSRGMDQFVEELSQIGVTARVDGFVACSSVAETAIGEYRRHPSLITLIGHSAGGSCTLKFAEMLQAENIPVSLLITIDPTRLDRMFDYKLPLNVERYINIFQSNDVLGGRDVALEQGFRGYYASFDLSQHGEINHITIDKIPSIHEQIVAKIQQLPMMPTSDHAETVPIHLIVPADAPIELWDGGMPVFARTGETLQTLAAANQVPVWALLQINQETEAAAASLAKGQRVVVPRRLVPQASSGASKVSGRAPSPH